MIENEYNDLKRKFNFVQSHISYNFGLLDSRWLERRMNKNDTAHDKDLDNLLNIYEDCMELQKIVKQYIE
jgi:hypothetical protein